MKNSNKNSLIITTKRIIERNTSFSESFDWFKTQKFIFVFKSLLKAIDFCHKVDLALIGDISIDSFVYEVSEIK